MINALLLCKSKEDAKWIAQQLNERIDNPYGWNQQHIQYAARQQTGVNWWKDDKPPVIPCDWDMSYWQREQSNEDFLTLVSEKMEARKSLHKQRAELLQTSFPNMQWKPHEYPYHLFLRLAYDNCETPIELDDSGFPNAIIKVAKIDHNQLIQMALHDRFDNLYFSIWNDVIHTYLARFWKGERYDRCSVDIDIEYPLTDENKRVLAHWNEIGKQANQDDKFYCTHCKSIKPNVEYAGFHFHDVRCKECASPVWLKTAREESYN